MKNRGKNYIAYFLLAVSVMILAVTFFPHHHHGQHFCPITLCEKCHTWGCSCEHNGDAQSGEHSNANRPCDTDCVTRFRYLTPGDSHDMTEADYTFFTLIYPLWTQIGTLFQAEESSEPDLYYLEKLHARLFNSSVGLRAPPFMVFA